MKGRILAVDPGDKRIGLAVSDPSGTIASPLRVINHVSRVLDAAQIASVAAEMDVALILVGESLDDDGNPTPEGRKALRLADAIRLQSPIPVEMWDESFSTQTARETRIAMGVRRSKRKGHMDELAATVILQSYLEVSLSGQEGMGT
jgi:putative Holliday junction resolvase